MVEVSWEEYRGLWTVGVVMLALLAVVVSVIIVRVVVAVCRYRARRRGKRTIKRVGQVASDLDRLAGDK